MTEHDVRKLHTGCRRPMITSKVSIEEAMVLLKERSSVVWDDDLDESILNDYFLNEFSS